MPQTTVPGWRRLLAAYWIASFVEGYGVAQIYAFLPNRLAEVGMAAADIPRFVGILSSLFFLAGLPLVPFWGVWADKYSRKAVIIRSALVECAVFGAVAASREPWQLVLAMLLVAFQLGNSGVMLAAIRDATPHHRLGLAMGIFAASSPLGFGAGPTLGAAMIDHLHVSSAGVFGVAAALSLGVAAVLAAGSAEVRPPVVPSGSSVRLAYGAVRGVFADPTVRWLFLVAGLVQLGAMMSQSYMSLLVHDIEGTSFAVAGSVGLVLGVATIVGAVMSPAGGWLADRAGFRRVLAGATAGLALATLALPLTPAVVATAGVYGLAIAFRSVAGAMVAGLLAVELPPARRSATLNLSYLPLYFGGIVGPAIGAVVVPAGLRAVFFAAGLVLIVAVGVAVAFVRRGSAAGEGSAMAAGSAGPV
jgi:DHA1 family multidrug resistance protein-like MFS transporter